MVRIKQPTHQCKKINETGLVVGFQSTDVLISTSLQEHYALYLKSAQSHVFSNFVRILPLNYFNLILKETIPHS